MATFLKRSNDSNLIVNESAIMKHDRHQCLFDSKKHLIIKYISYLAISQHLLIIYLKDKFPSILVSTGSFIFHVWLRFGSFTCCQLYSPLH